MGLKIAALLLVLSAVIIIAWGIAIVHTLPGKIATKRNHSQAKAIEVMSLLGLLMFPLWMGALIWAYIEPVKIRAKIESKPGDGGGENQERPATVQVGDDGTPAQEA